MTNQKLEEGWRLQGEIKSVEQALENIDNNIKFSRGCRDNETVSKVERALRQDAHDLLNVELAQLRKQFESL